MTLARNELLRKKSHRAGSRGDRTRVELFLACIQAGDADLRYMISEAAICERS